MARPKSNKRKTSKSRVQKQLKTRCMGHNKDQSRCYRTVAHTREQTMVYCSTHAQQALSADGVPRIRLCDGLIQTYERCFARVPPSLPRDRPAFCGAHQAQRHLHKTVQCFGVDDAGQRCTQQILWKSPFGKFCTSHEDQETSFGCPITQLSDDAAAIVLDLLKPYERVAFALCNKSCARLVKSWNRGRDMNLPKSHMLIYRPHEKDVHTRSRRTAFNKDFTVELDYNHSMVAGVPKRLQFSSGFRCACVIRRTPGSYTMAASRSYDTTNPTTIHDTASSLHGLLLLRTIRAQPYLFGPGLKRCVCCKAQLIAKDSKYWSKAPAYKTQAIAQRHEIGEVKHDDNPETIFCRSCDSANAKIEIEWCQKCHGEPTVTALARGYWNVQKEAREVEAEFDSSSLEDQESSDED